MEGKMSMRKDGGEREREARGGWGEPKEGGSWVLDRRQGRGKVRP